jgi:hypothetical protein
MSPALEKVKRRPRLERIDAALADDEAKLAAAKAKIAELVTAEDEAVVEAKRRDPGANPYALREPAQVARAEREKLERSLDGVLKGIAALKAERVTAEREQAAARLSEYLDDGRDLLAKEREARLAAGKLFGQVADAWNALAPLLQRRSELRAKVAGERLLELVGADTEVARRWEQVADFAVEPVPVDFAAFVSELLEAALAERTDVAAEHAAVADINARRRAQAAKDPGGFTDLPLLPKPVIADDPLHEFVPDLRETLATAQVAGVGVRRSGPLRETLEGLREAGFGLDLPSSAA